MSHYAKSNRILVALLLILSLAGCMTPQVLEDEEVFKSLDALWTTLTSRKQDRLQAVQTDLVKLHETGRLSDSGWRTIDPIIKKGAAGEWESAAKSLKRFIRNQRPSRKTND